MTNEASKIGRYLGPTTEPVQLEDGSLIRFDAQVLEKMVLEVQRKFVPVLNEHLEIFPPIGRVQNGEVVNLPSGEKQFVAETVALNQFNLDNSSGPILESCTLESLEDDEENETQFYLEVEPRNFDREIWEEMVSTSKIPVKEANKYSSLPPLVWILTIPTIWSAKRFVGAFLDELGSSAGEELIKWIKKFRGRAKSANRESYFGLQFQVDENRIVYGFVPFKDSEDSYLKITDAIRNSNFLAEVALAQFRNAGEYAFRIAYIFKEGEWHLAWFVTNQGVFTTNYWSENPMDFSEFLASEDE